MTADQVSRRAACAGAMIFGGLMLLAAPASPALAQATTYPDHTVRIIVTFPPGGGSDVVARLIGERLSTGWHQPVVVENRPGASGIIAARLVSKAEPDGYTMLVGSNSLLSAQILNPSLDFDLLRDLIPLVSMAYQPNIIVAAPDLPVRSLANLIALAKTRRLTYGSPGLGSIPQFVAEYLFTTMAGVHLDHVPYPGAAQALTATMAGQIDASLMTMPPAVPLVLEGKVRGLAVTSAERSPALPEVPTVAELGFSAVAINVWTGFFVPPGTPAATAAIIRDALLQAAEAPDIKAKFVALGFTPTTTSGDRLQQDIANEAKSFTEVARKANIKLE